MITATSLDLHVRPNEYNREWYYSAYHISWLFYMLCYLAIYLYVMITASDAQPARDFWLLCLASVMLVSRTTYLVPLASISISVARMIAYRRFNFHNIAILNVTRSIQTFVPMVLCCEILLSVPHKSVSLARKILRALLGPCLGIVAVYVVLGVSVGCFYLGGSIADVTDILLSLPYNNLEALSESSHVFGRIWYVILRLTFAMSIIVVASTVGSVILSYDEAKALSAWQQDWRTPSDRLSLYNTPAFLLETLWRAILQMYRSLEIFFRQRWTRAFQRHRIGR